MSIESSSFKDRATVLDPSEAEDDCPICMDKPTQPRKLEKCGHIFCSDCIEAYFENLKPTCPCCGAIYWKGDRRPARWCHPVHAGLQNSPAWICGIWIYQGHLHISWRQTRGWRNINYYLCNKAKCIWEKHIGKTLMFVQGHLHISWRQTRGWRYINYYLCNKASDTLGNTLMFVQNSKTLVMLIECLVLSHCNRYVWKFADDRYQWLFSFVSINNISLILYMCIVIHYMPVYDSTKMYWHGFEHTPSFKHQYHGQTGVFRDLRDHTSCLHDKIRFYDQSIDSQE